MSITFIFLALILVIPILIIIIYNRLVKNRNLMEEGWSGIEVQLKRRTNLIPNLIESVKGYMKHEKELLSDITRLRSESMKVNEVAEKSKLENALTRSLGNLFAVAESYPDLKANENFLDLQNELSEIEDQIQMSRRYYNGTVRNLNILIESFPSNIIANMFNFTKGTFFELEDAEDGSVPRVKF
ncbi:MAG: LemA family protein [candidate division KSB1 bacterium]|jgi:LemA protein|nr:LemA family protein [candidate division KSB1 bacterium]